VAVFNRSRSIPRSVRRTVRRPSWSRGPNGILQRTSSGAAIFATGAQANFDELTVIRIRGVFEIFLSVAAAALDGFDGAFGICRVSENAFNAGAGSIPSPLTDVAWDGWQAYQMFSLKAVTATIADGVNAVGVYKRFELDTKAMRKTNITDVLVGVIEATEVGTATMNMRLDSRMLHKSMQ